MQKGGKEQRVHVITGHPCPSRAPKSTPTLRNRYLSGNRALSLKLLTWSPLLGTRHSGRLLFEGHLVQVLLCAAQRGHLQKQLSLSPHSGLKGLEYLP